MIQVVDLLADHPLVKVWGASFLSKLWWRCDYKSNYTQLGLLSYVDVSFVFYECQKSNKNDEGLLVGRLVVPRPDEYVGLDLT